MIMKKNIALIGMMGCGKTTVAKELNKFIPEYKLIDIDSLIEKNSDKKISEIFLKFGENHFRVLEADRIKKVFSEENQIVSLGGGAFESQANRLTIKENSIVFYLKASADVIFERIKNEFHRPLLQKNCSPKRIEEILTKREKNYLKADYCLNTDYKTPEKIAREIMGILND